MSDPKTADYARQMTPEEQKLMEIRTRELDAEIACLLRHRGSGLLRRGNREAANADNSNQET